MRCLVVGGWVRDTLLSRQDPQFAPKDRDWVVLGGTPEEMERAGFVPVGRDFPVFLHPKTHEEYALARTERKSGKGYHGFVFCTSPSVTLEEDLARRDLTINAMALDEEGRIIDPFGGRRDLEEGVLRHVSPSFVEDPVRLLRVARFAARFPRFRVAAETRRLLEEIVQSGEADALVAERVCAEMLKAFKEKAVSHFFRVIGDCGFQKRFFPGWNTPETLLEKLDGAVGLTPEEKLALAFMETTEADRRSLAAKMRLPLRCSDLVLLAPRLRSDAAAPASDPAAVLNILERYDAQRRPERFEELLKIAAASGADTDTEFWLRAQNAASSPDIRSALQQKPADIPVKDFVRGLKEKAVGEIVKGIFR
jgi:tRNA nucleotidyltransferase (CCA-adding enzyme)